METKKAGGISTGTQTKTSGTIMAHEEPGTNGSSTEPLSLKPRLTLGEESFFVGTSHVALGQRKNIQVGNAFWFTIENHRKHRHLQMVRSVLEVQILTFLELN